MSRRSEPMPGVAERRILCAHGMSFDGNLECLGGELHFRAFWGQFEVRGRSISDPDRRTLTFLQAQGSEQSRRAIASVGFGSFAHNVYRRRPTGLADPVDLNIAGAFWGSSFSLAGGCA